MMILASRKGGNQNEKNAIPIGDKLSAASKRALERNTIQFAEDGINFEIKSHIQWGPHAVGLVRSLDTDKSPLEAMCWGLCHEYKGDWQYIKRFESYVPRAWQPKLHYSNLIPGRRLRHPDRGKAERRDLAANEK